MKASQLVELAAASETLRQMGAVVFEQRKFSQGETSERDATRLRVMFAFASQNLDGDAVRTNFVVWVMANPLVSIGRDRPSILEDAALALKDALHWQTVGGCLVRLVSMARDDDEGREYRIRLEFEALASHGAVKIDGVALTLESLETRSDATVEVEADRSGDEIWHAETNHHRVLDATALTTDPAIPPVGSLFMFDGTVWLLTEYSRSSSADGFSVRFAARTFIS